MWVVIMCGGMGTRLREETEFKPKPMVKVGPQPILWHILKHYAHFGHKDFALALGYKGEMIKNYFIDYDLMTHDFTVRLGERSAIETHNSRPPEDWRVVLADTGLSALKGARLKRVAKYVQGDRFMMTYGDGVADVDLDVLLDFHKSHGKMVTVTGVVPSMRFGEVAAREDGTVIRFTEKPKGGPALVNGGYYILEREVLDLLTEQDDCDFEYGPLEQLAEQGELMMYRHEGFWHCMDNVRDMQALNRMWDSGERPWVLWND